jgi:hypothetical protein
MVNDFQRGVYFWAVFFFGSANRRRVTFKPGCNGVPAAGV